MEKIKQYQKIIISLLEEYEKDWTQPNSDVKYQVIADEKRNRFQLICIGWENGTYFHNTVFHLDIINEKIWIQENATDVLLAPELMKQGVSNEAIVLGMQPERKRKYTGFAVC
jgi:XisI protein